MGLATMRRTRVSRMSMLICFASFILVHVHAGKFHVHQNSGSKHHDKIRKMQELKATNFLGRGSVSLPPTPLSSLQQGANSPREYHVTSYGADPTGMADSTDAILAALSVACKAQSGGGSLMTGITNLGGVRINLEGGIYVITRPLTLPAAGLGNIMIHGGTLRASDNFPEDGYLIDLSAPSGSESASYNYEYMTIKDITLDSNYRGGGISVINSLRISIDNCYIVHFTTNGILVQGGHETYIRNSFLGQHITAGGDPGERNFSGTAINLMGNDNAVTDVIIFSASVGIMISGQANILSGVHCYNKATGFGGAGIYLKLPGLTQTRIVNCYLDYTGIVAEDPVQLDIADSFFLGDAYILLKSINGVASGVNIVGNMFSGSDKGIDIVKLDESMGRFEKINQVIVDRNNVKGMSLRATVAKGSAQGNGTSWNVDFNHVLLFPNLIKHVHYSLSASDGSFPNHALRNVSNNNVVIEANAEVSATVFVSVDQSVQV